MSGAPPSRGLAVLGVVGAVMLGGILLAIQRGHHVFLESADRLAVAPDPAGLVGLGVFGAGLASLVIVLARVRGLWRDPDAPALRSLWRSPPGLVLLAFGCVVVLAAITKARSELSLDASGLRHTPPVGTRFEGRWPEIQRSLLLQRRNPRWTLRREEVERTLALGTAQGAHLIPLGGYTLEEIERLIAWIERRGVQVKRRPLAE